MNYLVVLLWVLCCSATSAVAQVSVGIGIPGVSIGINLPVYPQLVAVPGYPVYYAPHLTRTSSSTTACTGSTRATTGTRAPGTTVLGGSSARSTCRCSCCGSRCATTGVPPPYFRGWKADAPPRWGEHWGDDWSQQRRGWDQWNRKSVPAPAPLPSYQRQYSGDRYPRQIEQQQALRNQNYRYQPRDPVVQQHDQAQRSQAGAPQDRGSGPKDVQRASPQGPPQKDVNAGPQQRGPAAQDQGRPPSQGSTGRPQEVPKSSQNDLPQGHGKSQAPKQGHEQEPGQLQGQGQGQSKGRDK